MAGKRLFVPASVFYSARNCAPLNRALSIPKNFQYGQTAGKIIGGIALELHVSKYAFQNLIAQKNRFQLRIAGYYLQVAKMLNGP